MVNGGRKIFSNDQTIDDNYDRVTKVNVKNLLVTLPYRIKKRMSLKVRFNEIGLDFFIKRFYVIL